MEGFTLKCNKCGREIQLKGKNFYTKQLNEYPENDKLYLGISFGYEEIEIECVCGNRIED